MFGLTTITAGAVTAPTFTSFLQSFQQASINCAANSSQCVLPNMAQGEVVGTVGWPLIIIGLAIILISVSILHTFAFKAAHKKQPVEEEIISVSLKEKKEIAPVTDEFEGGFKPQRAKVEKESQPQGKKAGMRSGGLSALAGTDVMSTNLDLARVYMDMGSTNDARKLIKKVVISGNDAQKATAEKMLEKLDA